jgi:hypothetical protein
MHSGVKFSFLGHFTWNPCRIHKDCYGKTDLPIMLTRYVGLAPYVFPSTCLSRYTPYARFIRTSHLPLRYHPLSSPLVSHFIHGLILHFVRYLVYWYVSPLFTNTIRPCSQ